MSQKRDTETKRGRGEGKGGKGVAQIPSPESVAKGGDEGEGGVTLMEMFLPELATDEFQLFRFRR